MIDKNCVFCKIIQGEIKSEKVYEDNDVVAFKDLNPVAPVHILIVPKKHITNVLDIRETNASVIEKIFSAINKIAKDLNIADSGFRVVTNCGEDAGQEVKHLHFHLIGGEKLNNLK